MKKTLLFTLLVILSSKVYSQTNFKINLLTSIDHSVLDVRPTESFYNVEYEDEKDFGYTLDLGIEAKTSASSAVVFGIKTSKKVYNPDREIIFYYGGLLSHDEDTLYVTAPHLRRLEYQTISIPIYHKHYFLTNHRFSFYTLIGGSAEFRIKGKETYTDYMYSAGGTEENGKITASKKEIKLFGTSMEVGGGITAKLSNRLSLLFQANFHVFEFRKQNEQLIVLWPSSGYEYQQHWKDDFLTLGQVSFGLGFQVDLNRTDKL